MFLKFQGGFIGLMLWIRLRLRLRLRLIFINP